MLLGKRNEIMFGKQETSDMACRLRLFGRYDRYNTNTSQDVTTDTLRQLGEILTRPETKKCHECEIITWADLGLGVLYQSHYFLMTTT